jgi:hypothetical protein
MHRRMQSHGRIQSRVYERLANCRCGRVFASGIGGGDAITIDAIGTQRADRIGVAGVDARECREQPVQIDHGIEVVGFGGLDQTVEHGTGMGTGNGIAEQPVLAADDDSQLPCFPTRR